MKKLMMLVLVAFVMSSCATIEYFKRPENQKVLMDAGITCFEGSDYTLGVEYGLTRDGQEITNATQVGGIIGCANKKFTVICDVTKKPDENPCSDIRSYTEDAPVNPTVEEPTPVVETPTPEPVAVSVPVPVEVVPAVE